MDKAILSFDVERLKVRGRMLGRWWLKRHRSFQPFFVIATCRSGSNLLLSYLRCHKLTVLSEVLCSQSPYGPARDELSPEQAIRHLRLVFQAREGATRGCKLMLYQLKNCHLSLERLDAEFPGAKYIVLYRENLAEQYVSHLKSLATQQFALRAGEEKRNTQVHVDRQALAAYCEEIRAGYEQVLRHAELRERSVLLSYEELVRDTDRWLGEIASLLGVEAASAHTRLLKQNDQPLSASVSNYGEVASILARCKQQHAWPARRRLAA